MFAAAQFPVACEEKQFSRLPAKGHLLNRELLVEHYTNTDGTAPSIISQPRSPTLIYSGSSDLKGGGG